MDVPMRVIQCANCHLPFAIPSRFEEDRRSDHKEFYCPKGHVQFFPGKSDEEKLKEKLKSKDQQLEAKLKELAEAREAARTLREARIEFIGKYFKEQFKQGKKFLVLKDVAPVFGMKARELKEHIDIYTPEFKCVRSGKGYQIVKFEKENK